MMNKQVKVTFKTGEVIEGKVMDVTADGRFILVENEIDFYNIDTEVTNVEVIEEAAKEEVIEEHITLAELKKEIVKATRYMDEYEVYMEVYEEGETFDVIVNVKEEGEIVESYGVSTFSNEKKATQRAKAILKSIAKYAEVNNEIKSTSL